MDTRALCLILLLTLPMVMGQAGYTLYETNAQQYDSLDIDTQYQLFIQAGGYAHLVNNTFLGAISGDGLDTIWHDGTHTLYVLSNQPFNATILSRTPPLALPSYSVGDAVYKIDIPARTISAGIHTVEITSAYGSILYPFTVLDAPDTPTDEQESLSLWPFIAILAGGMVLIWAIYVLT